MCSVVFVNLLQVKVILYGASVSRMIAENSAFKYHFIRSKYASSACLKCHKSRLHCFITGVLCQQYDKRQTEVLDIAWSILASGECQIILLQRH